MTDDASPLVWQDGLPRSRLFGDIYYSLDDGLAESRAVFLAGCGLPQAWAGRRRFVVAELGFGTGLNIAALLDAWRENHSPGARLSIFSIEAYPLSRDEAAQALRAWPQISDAAEALLAAWPSARRGMHRLDLPGFDATLDLFVGDVAEGLATWSGRADSWFLDGFSPALNPDMWRDEVLALAGARSAPGARCATFTVAGQVRRGLEAAGFSVTKQPGYGRKRQRLEAVFPGESPSEPPAPRIAILGAGVAGASLARAFVAQGAAATVICGPQPAASGNPAALVMPALDAGGGARAGLFAQAFARAAELYGAIPGALIARSALQLESAPRDAARFDVIAGQPLFAPMTVERLEPAEAASRLSEPRLTGALSFQDAVVVDPRLIREAWIDQAHTGTVIAIERDGEAWKIVFADASDQTFDLVVLATGWSPGLAEGAPILAPVRGQASWTTLATPPAASAAGAYAIPTRDGVLFGATHDRGRTDLAVETADHSRNLENLAVLRPNLAADVRGRPIEGRVGIRATTPDRLPVAGKIAEGLYVLSGLGSRGFTAAPLLAEHVAALALGAPSPLPSGLAKIVDPNRFA